MTRRTNARVAGVAYLAYFVLGIGSMVLAGRANHGSSIAERLTSIASHLTDMRAALVLTLFSSFMALVLGVTLYALTRDQDPDVAMMGLVFRAGEGVAGALGMQHSLGLLWLATVTGPKSPDADTARALGTLFLRAEGGGVAAVLFAVGSACFCWLLLRGRMIPTWLAGIGFLASILWIVGYPLQMVGVLPNVLTYPMWALMALFELPFAAWLIVKGVAPPARMQA